MASSYVNDLRLNEMATGDASGTWGTTTNTNLELIGNALGYGTEAITTNADTHASTVADGSADAARAMYIKYTGTLDSTCTITIGPNTMKRVHIIENATSGSQSIIIKQGSGATITIPTGDTKVVMLDGAGSGAAVVDAFASLSVVDLKVQDDLTVTDDMTVGGTLGVTGVLTATSLDISGDIDVDGTTNLDVVDIDGAVDMASTLNVSGAITGTLGTAAQTNITSLGTLTTLTVDNISLNSNTIANASSSLVLDSAGDIILDADGQDIVFKDDGTQFGSIRKNGNNIEFKASIQDGDITFHGDDGGAAITALQLDMSAAGAATFNSSVTSLQNIVTQTGGDFAATFTTPFDFVAKFESTDSNAFIVLEDNSSTNNANRIGAVGDSIQIESGGVENVIFTSTSSVFNENSVDMDFRIESNDNANMLFVDGGNNRVGIAHAVPDANLHAISSANNTQMPFIIGNEDNTSSSTSQSVKMGFGLARDSGTVKNDAGAITVGKDAAWTADDGNIDAHMFFSTFTSNSLTEKLRIDSLGNVGIGTNSGVGITAGVTSLSISDAGSKGDGDKNGVLAFKTDDASYTNTYSDGVTSEIHSISTSSTGAAYGLGFVTGTITSSNRAERLRIDHNGNVGIGTDSPVHKLVLNGTDSRMYITGANTDIDMDASANGQISIDGNGYGAAIALNAQGLNIYNNSSSRDLIFGTNETERVRIDGSAGAFTTNPAAGGHAVFNEGSVDADFRVESDGKEHMLFVEGSTNRVGINNGVPTKTLDVSGVPYISNSGFAFHTLDKEITSGTADFTFGELNGECGDNFAYLVIVSLYNPSSSTTFEHAGYVGFRITPRGGGGTLTQISKTLASGVSTFTVAALNDGMRVTADTSPTLRARVIVLGGGGVSVSSE